MITARRISIAVGLAVSALLACNRSTPPEPLSKTQPAEAATPLDTTSFRVPGGERIVAIGDVHGDLQATRAALRLAGAIDSADHWSGGKLIVVQTGDQLDRGDDEPQILDLFDRLQQEARAAGGAFHVLNGNHEIMNVAADYRYVTPDGFSDWHDTHADGPRQSSSERLPAEQRGRAAAFLPGGPGAKRLAERPIVLSVGDTLFAHGGVLEEHVRYGLGRLNSETREWMLGKRSTPPRALLSDRAPIWSRVYSDGLPGAAECAALANTLKLLGQKRLVVGHTVQRQGINSACGGKVWRIDVGLSKFYGGKPSVLEIRGDKVQVITAAPESADSAAPLASAPAPKRAPLARQHSAQAP